MKKIIVRLVLIGSSVFLPGLSHAQCVDAVMRTQSSVQDLFQQTLNADQQLHLRDLLLELCVQRVPGSSVVKQPGRTIYGTQGMNRDHGVGNDSENSNNSGNTAILLGIDLDRRKDRREHKETPHFPQ